MSLGGPKATESLSSGLQGKPQTGPVTAPPTAWPGPWSLEWLSVDGVAGGSHPHLCCDFQMLGALPRHPLLTLTPFQPPATPGSHSPLTLKAEVGVGPAGMDRPTHAPRQKGFPRQQGTVPSTVRDDTGDGMRLLVARGVPPQASLPGLRPVVCFWAGGCLQGCSGPGSLQRPQAADGLMTSGRGPISPDVLPGWAGPP